MGGLPVCPHVSPRFKCEKVGHPGNPCGWVVGGEGAPPARQNCFTWERPVVPLASVPRCTLLSVPGSADAVCLSSCCERSNPCGADEPYPRSLALDRPPRLSPFERLAEKDLHSGIRFFEA
jgi:hypothetical protein